MNFILYSFVHDTMTPNFMIWYLFCPSIGLSSVPFRKMDRVNKIFTKQTFVQCINHATISTRANYIFFGLLKKNPKNFVLQSFTWFQIKILSFSSAIKLCKLRINRWSKSDEFEFWIKTFKWHFNKRRR